MTKPTDHSFDPEELQAIGDAYEKSVKAIAPIGRGGHRRGVAHYHREAIAKTVLGAAKKGTRDVDELVDAAIDKMIVR